MDRKERRKIHIVLLGLAQCRLSREIAFTPSRALANKKEGGKSMFVLAEKQLTLPSIGVLVALGQPDEADLKAVSFT